MFLFPFLKRNSEIRNAPIKFPPISPLSAGKHRHFRPRLHMAATYFPNYAVFKWVFREFRLYCVASEVFLILYSNKHPPPPQEN